MKEFFREFSRFPPVILAIVFPGIASGGLSEIYLDFLCEVLQEQAHPFLFFRPLGVSPGICSVVSLETPSRLPSVIFWRFPFLS